MQLGKSLKEKHHAMDGRWSVGLLVGWSDGIEESTDPCVRFCLDLACYSSATRIYIGWNRFFDPTASNSDYRGFARWLLCNWN